MSFLVVGITRQPQPVAPVIPLESLELLQNLMLFTPTSWGEVAG